MTPGTCTPPINTPYNTRHVLRRYKTDVLTPIWNCDMWCGFEDGIGGGIYLSPTAVARHGWRYAGPCPPLPELPTEPWEIAEGALLKQGHILISDWTILADVALRQIAAMKPGAAP